MDQLLSNVLSTDPKAISSQWFFLLFIGLPVRLSSASDFSITTAQLYEPASLPCYHQCSGELKWLTSREQTVVATCDQHNRCRAKEGFEMSYEQFRKGNLSMTVTSADHSKKCWYIAACNGQKVCDCSLLIQPVHSSIVFISGQTLSLDLHTMLPLNVKFEGEDSSGNCTLNGRYLECTAKYKGRVNIINNLLVLTALTPSDTGFCIVRELETGDLVANITITVMVKNNKKSNEDTLVSQLEVKTFDIMRISTAAFNDALRSEAWREGYKQAIKSLLPAAFLFAILTGFLLAVLVKRVRCEF
ncbi:uncharacterized protein LOC113576943 isoform X2 [Electrophorus electricus]|uniref:uncharacterized protein LOC113576943 isoform X2 n=1 Tax=Electrophorus electricus TaxID=8005 RepID=UPI0015D08CCC|nr:uncharacterized protein LOC113576943 isoform X2 [Electrophorus electricus]XP_026865132.2 uncharacterized protein LOC113576943 isoform X2 [Electrophorus electricus]XP_026865133.2 uncharacterized protein LOC113576943 isoform X2 [Electrophorus electricus]